MNIEQVHPELRSTFKHCPSVPVHHRFIVALLQILMKIVPIPKAGPGVLITNQKLKNAGVRIYRPESTPSNAALLWIHGGGLIIGDCAQDDRLCGAFARDLKLTVVSVNYRLAPKHRFPSAIDDCFEVWEWLQHSTTEFAINPSHIVIAGQSAGGGLAATLAQRIFDTGGIQPAAQLLFCPMLDDRTGINRELDKIGHLLWNNRANRQAWTWYLGQPAGSQNIPPYAAAARRDNLAGLPKTWMSVGDIELFYDEVRHYAERLQRAGVLCQLNEVPQAPHAFESLAANTQLARDLMLSAYRFLCASVGFEFDAKNFSYGSTWQPQHDRHMNKNSD